MKKIYTLVAAAALAIGGIMYAATGDVVFEQPNFADYSNGLKSGPGDGTTWTKVMGLGSQTWAYNSQTNALRIWQGGTAEHNDWLVSPKLELEPGKTYEVTANMSFFATANKVEHVALHYVTQYPTVSGAESTVLPVEPLAQIDDLTGSTIIDGQDAKTGFVLNGTFVAVEGDCYVAVHAFGDLSGGLYLKSLTVTEVEGENPPRPIDPDPIEPEDPEDHDCAGLPTPYASNIATSSSSVDPDWTIIDANGDDKKWTAVSDFTSSMKISYTASVTPCHDDWMISPSIHLQKGKEYYVAYDYATDHATEMMDVYLTTSADPETILESTPIAVLNKENTSKKLTTQSVLFTPAATGDYCLSFHATTAPGNQWYIWVANVKVMENIFAPGAVTGLTATPAAYPTLEVNLSWTLPTVDVFGNAIPEDKTFEKLEIFRNDEPAAIAEFTEPVTEFTDTEATGLTPGKHTYSVVATYSGATSPVAKVGPTTYVGPIEAMAVPAEISASSDFAPAWLAAEGENQDESAIKWSINTGTTPSCMQASVNQGKVSDAWSFSPEFKVVEPGFYEVEIYATRSETYVPDYAESFLANAQSIDAPVMMPVAIDWTMFPSYTSNSAARQKATVYIAEPGNYCVATHVDYDGHTPIFTNSSYGSYKWYRIYSVSMAAGKMIPAAVTDLKAAAAEDESNNVTLTWTNPTLSTAGTELQPGSYYVEVYRQDGNDFTLLATITDGSNEYVDEVPASGAYTYAVKVLATGTDDALDDSEQATATSSWVGSRELALPYSVYLSVNTPANASRYIWEAVDNNQDGATWGFDFNDRMICMQPAEEIEGQPGYYQYDDYLLSPIFALEPGYYRLKFSLYGQSATHYVDGISSQEMYVNVGLAETGFVPGRSELIGKTLVSNKASYAQDKEVLFKVEAAGKYQVVFAADEVNYKIYSAASSYSSGSYPGLQMVAFAYAPVLPDVATDITVVPAENDEPSAVISWTNPTTSSIPGIMPEITKAYILRDGVQVGTVTSGLVPGEITSWEDNDVPGGRHTYAVQLFTEEGTHAADAPSVLSDWIGGGIEAPYSVDKFVVEGWDHYSPNMTSNTSYGYTYYSNCWDLEASVGARYDQSGYTDVDGYLMTPKFQLDHTQAYKLTIHGRKTSMDAQYQENGYPVEVLIGLEGTPDTWSKVCDIYVKNTSTATDDPEIVYIIGDENLESVPMLLAEAEGDGEGELDPETPETPAAPGETPETAIPVPAGGRKLAFHINNNWSSGNFSINKFFIDKEGSTTGIDLVDASGDITIAADGIHFTGTATDIAIYDLTGKLLSFSPKAEGSVSFAGLEKGIYIVRLALDGKPVALKIAL